MRNNNLSEITENYQGHFIEAETLFENEQIVIMKSYFFRKDASIASLFFDVEVGFKDQQGDIDDTRTLVKHQRAVS